MTHDVKRLYRSRDEARLVGVCGGLGDYLGIDPVLIRLLWVGITCITGFIPGILAYLFAWIIVPEQPHRADTPVPAERTHESGA